MNVCQELLACDENESREHILKSEQILQSIPGISPDIQPLPIRSAAVIGAGTMGNGIALNFLAAGVPVTLIDKTEELVQRGGKTIDKILSGSLDKGKISREDYEKALQALVLSTSYDGLKDVDLVVEAVFENMQLKQEVFKNLSKVCRPDAILATNTSTLSVDSIAGATSHPERVLGMHFFSPANIMKLLEIIKGKLSSAQSIVTAAAVGRLMRKVAVVVGNCDGFVANRMLNGYIRESDLLLEEGALPNQIDQVMTGFGFSMGPFAVGDLAGLDVLARIRQERKKRDGEPRFKESQLPLLLHEQGRCGQKTSAGWYRYESGSRQPLVDEKVTEIILAESARLGIDRRSISDEEIIKRCLYPVINEGARILEEGIASRPSDIDLIWIYGYGFPTAKGGPMFWADGLGLSAILDELRKFQKLHGDFWQPAPLLEKLVREGKKFRDLQGV